MPFLLAMLTAMVCMFAGLAQIACVLSPDTGDQRILNSARKVTAVGLIVACLFIMYSAWQGSQVNAAFLLVVGIFALGQILFAVHALYEPHFTERLMAHRYTPRSHQ